MKVMHLVRGNGPYVEHTEFCRGDSFQPIDGDHKNCSRSIVIGPGRVVRYQGGMQVVTLGALIRCESCMLSYVVSPDWGYVEEVDGGTQDSSSD